MKARYITAFLHIINGLVSIIVVMLGKYVDKELMALLVFPIGTHLVLVGMMFVNQTAIDWSD